MRSIVGAKRQNRQPVSELMEIRRVPDDVHRLQKASPIVINQRRGCDSLRGDAHQSIPCRNWTRNSPGFAFCRKLGGLLYRHLASQQVIRREARNLPERHPLLHLSVCWRVGIERRSAGHSQVGFGWGFNRRCDSRDLCDFCGRLDTDAAL